MSQVSKKLTGNSLQPQKNRFQIFNGNKFKLFGPTCFHCTIVIYLSFYPPVDCEVHTIYLLKVLKSNKFTNDANCRYKDAN